MNRNAILFLAFIILGHPRKPQPISGEGPALAVESNGSLQLLSATGHELRVVKTSRPIGSFAVSKDGKTVAFTPLRTNQDLYGGPLYLLQAGRLERVTHGPYYNKLHRPTEVYSDPNFSPDGKRVVFSIHSQPTGDLVEASGPFAILDVTTKKIRILKDTLHVAGEAWGTAFASSAFWSPDGRRILLNFEDGSSLTDPLGSNLEDLSALMQGEDWTNSLGWLGPHCIAYITGKDYLDARQRPARFLNLKTGHSGTLDTLLALTHQQVTNLVAIEGKIRVRRQGNVLLIESNDSQWSIPDKSGRTLVQILPRPSSEAPEGCR